MLTPGQTFEKVAEAAKAKAEMGALKLLVMGIFAGVFIALAGVGATLGNIYGGRLAGACIFPVGLVMVVVAGSELFTGNNLMVMGLFSRKVGVGGILRNWAIVYVGNFLGALMVVGLVAVSGVLDPVADTVVATSFAKANMEWGEALFRGVLCNFLVCIAVWMAFAADTVGGKAVAVFVPVMLFVLCGFEHSVANMFYGPMGMMMGAMKGVAVPTVSGFLLNNLLPVTLGNIVGGAVLVGGGYSLVHAWRKK